MVVDRVAVWVANAAPPLLICTIGHDASTHYEFSTTGLAVVIFWVPRGIRVRCYDSEKARASEPHAPNEAW